MAKQDEIVADLERMGKVAEKMLETANALYTVAGEKYAGGVDTICSAWVGDTANQFTAKASVVMNDMVETAQHLGEAAETLVTVAKNYAEAELKAMQK